MFAISPTDNSWFNYLKKSELNSFVNFWTPTPWNIKQLKVNDRLYFMLKSPVRKIGGFGEFVEYKNMSAYEAWNEFGFRNGRETREEFINSIHQYVYKHSVKVSRDLVDVNFLDIGCIILNNCQFWETEDFVDVNDYDIFFANQVVTIKYFNEYDPFSQKNINLDNFNLIHELRKNKRGEVNIRDGQGEFKGKLLKAYNNTCCVTGENIPELLDGAHIQEYKNRSSNHIQNGLLLRVDIHRLYDNGLIFIDQDYVVKVSNLVINTIYRQYHGKPIQKPLSERDYPSKAALEFKSKDFRK